MRLGVGLLFLIFWGSAAQAWTVDAVEQCHFQSKRPELIFQNPYSAVMWTGVQIEIKLTQRKSMDNQVWMETSQFDSGRMPVLLHVQKEKRPLTVVIPGFGSNLKDRFSQFGQMNFSDRGHHVLVVPNPAGSDYLSQRPKHVVTDKRAQASVILDLIRQAVMKIGKDKISEVQLYGESFGAFLAPLVFAEDIKSGEPVITGKVSLFGPPLHLARSMLKLDSNSLQFLGDEKNLPDSYLKNISQGMRVVSYMAPESFAKGLVTDFKIDQIQVSRAFGGYALDSAKLTQELGLISSGAIPNFENNTEAERAWRESMRGHEFRFMAQNFLGAGFKVEDFSLDDRSLVFWIQSIPVEQRKRIQIFSSKDDFVNYVDDWKEFKKYADLPDESVILLEWGSHLGVLGSQLYQQILDSEFGRYSAAE